MQKYRNDPRFDYTQKKPPLTFLDKFKLWLLHKLSNFFRFTSRYYVWDIILYLILAFSIILIILKLIRADIGGLFSRRKKTIHDRSTILKTLDETDIDELDSLIEEFRNNGQYRLAVRLLYNRLLKDLSNKKVITWRVDKTDRQYQKEIQNTKIKKGFVELSRIFAYTWYGNSELNIKSFDEIYNRFKKMESHIYNNGDSHE